MAASESVVNPIREGFRTLTPYIVVRQVEEILEFVQRAFGAEVKFRGTGSAGGLHCEVKIGDSMLMIGGGPQCSVSMMPTALHLYLPDADAAYNRAVTAGTTSLHAPIDQPYGDREAVVRDVGGNEWYIATNKETGHAPVGMSTVTAYLHPSGADRVLDFVKVAFGAEEVARYVGSDGAIQHAQVRIGNSILEMSEAHGQWQPMPTAFYMYVTDADTVYKRALAAGGKTVYELADKPYGDRNGGVEDPFGNHWYIATHIRD